ncbi:hypothetical protein [Escherichia coli]|uniref:hypothetical protein n=1 Tax=Escherichia coli TaxID=562 RepID=UPI00406955B5
MTEQKRPVLTLKRKTEGETPVRSRKTIINVTTPPKWKVKSRSWPRKQPGKQSWRQKKSAGQTGAVHLSEPAHTG